MNMHQAISEPQGCDWPAYCLFRKRFAEAMDPRLFTLRHLDSMVYSGRAKCWTSPDAAIVAELKMYPTGALVVEGVIAAGELDAIKGLIPLAEQWGRERGAIMAKIDSRPGWVRALKNDGYAPFQQALLKEL